MPAGFVRNSQPFAIVWENPLAVNLPVGDYLSNLIADAGADQCIRSAAAATDVVFDAAASVVPARKVTYTWRLLGGDCGSEGAKATFKLTKGRHRVELIIKDEQGNVSRDASDVEVR